MLPVPYTIQLQAQCEQMSQITNESRKLFVDKKCEGVLTRMDPDWKQFFYRAAESDSLVLYAARMPP